MPELQPAAPARTLASAALQRTCACGNHSGGGECAVCRAKRERSLQRSSIDPERQIDIAAPAALGPRFGHDFSRVPTHAARPNAMQAKLAINQPGDVYEQEADHVAEQVMRMPAPQVQRACSCGAHSSGGECAACRAKHESSIQRAAINSDPATAPPIVHDVLSGSGRPLDPATRAFMEPRFGADFSQVRVHTDAPAAASAREVNALAYTVGRNVVFGSGQYEPGSSQGRRLLAHELAHVMQQGSASPQPAHGETSQPAAASPAAERMGRQISGVVQRAGDPKAVPPGFPCPTDFTAGAIAGTDVPFTTDAATITPTHTALLTPFVTTWTTGGGTDDILVHGYASVDGDQGHNWTLSCERAQAVRTELIRLGVPAVRIEIDAHGASTDFGTSAAANRHAVVSTSPGGILPLVTGVLTARDNFSGRSPVRFGVGETIDLSFFSLPPRPATDFGGLEWRLASGGGTLTPSLVPGDGTATYTAPATADTVQLELRVAGGATAGSIISTHTITIVIPSAVRMVASPGTAPHVSPSGGTIPAGTFGAGFLANVFIDPKDVSFQGVLFGEGTVAGVVTPPGSFLGPSSAHPTNTFGLAHGGNATTGTAVSPPQDRIATASPPSGSLFGAPTCGISDFLWAIPWEFSVAGGPRTPFATANHHETSSFFCNATIEKGGAGPFCRRIDGTIC